MCLPPFLEMNESMFKNGMIITAIGIGEALESLVNMVRNEEIFNVRGF